MRSIPASLQTTYANLLEAHLNLPAFALEGSPYKMERRGKFYWYANQRGPGTGLPKQRYLGPDTEQMRERIEAMRANSTDIAQTREACTRMVAQLRAGGIPAIDQKTGSALRAMTKSGVFRLGGTLVGTQAFRHYDLELGAILSGADPRDQTLRETEELDIASFERLSATVVDEADPDLAKSLLDLGYKPANSLDMTKPTRWKHDRSIYMIDFLTPSFDDHQGPRHLAAMNLWAQSLHYLDFLIKDPMPAVSIYMEGLLVQIPRPERYAIHKLIVSQKRHAGSGAKARKDLQQARAIIWAMAEDRQHELNSAIAEADARGPKWREALDRSLDLQIAPSAPVLAGDAAAFEGKALGGDVRLRVSASALVQLAGEDEDILLMARKHRARLESMFRTRFRTAPGPDILLASYNLPEA